MHKQVRYDYKSAIDVWWFLFLQKPGVPPWNRAEDSYEDHLFPNGAPMGLDKLQLNVVVFLCQLYTKVK